MIRSRHYLILLLVVWLLFSITPPTYAITISTLESRPEDIGSHTSIAIGSDGLAAIAYFDATSSDLVFAHCLDVRCATAYISKIDAIGQVGEYVSIALTSAGLPVLSYRYTNGVRIAICNDVTCTAPSFMSVPTTNTVNDTAVAIGIDTFPVVAYSVQGEGTRVAKCNDALCATFNDTLLDNRVGTSISIAITTDLGTPVITYVANQALRIVKCASLDCLSVEDNVRVVGANGIVYYASMVLRGTLQHPIIAYKYNDNGANPDGLYVIECDDYLCINDNTASENVVVDADGNVGEYVSLAIDVDGTPVISHFKSNTQDLRITKCRVIDCKPASQPGIADTLDIDTTNDVGRFSAIALNSVIGQPIIAYYDNTQDNPKVAVYGNAAPEIMPVGDPNPIPGQTITEGGVLAFRVYVQDFDNSPSADAITYSIIPISSAQFPTGATIDNNGYFEWDTWMDELPFSSYGFRVVVDDGTGQDADNVIIDVVEDNKAPLIASIDNFSANPNPNPPITITPNTTDTDLPADTLTYSLDPLPTNGDFSFDPATGVFIWTPIEVGVYPFTLTVSDNGTPMQQDTEKFTVTVGQPLLVNGGFEEPSLDSGGLALAWNGKQLTKDKRKCGVGYALQGTCAFQFTGSVGERSSLSQSVSAERLATLNVGDQITASVAIKPTNAVIGKVVIMSIKYTSGYSEKIAIFDIDNTTGEYQTFDNADTPYIVRPFNGTVAKIKVKIQYRGTSGKFLIDAVDLSHLPALQQRDSTQPLP